MIHVNFFMPQIAASTIADFCLIPIGTGQASVAEYIAKVQYEYNKPP